MQLHVSLPTHRSSLRSMLDRTRQVMKLYPTGEVMSSGVRNLCMHPVPYGCDGLSLLQLFLSELCIPATQHSDNQDLRQLYNKDARTFAVSSHCLGQLWNFPYVSHVTSNETNERANKTPYVCSQWIKTWYCNWAKTRNTLDCDQSNYSSRIV